MLRYSVEQELGTTGKVFYVTGVRGVGKSALIREVSSRLIQNSIKALVLPEWTERPEHGISDFEFAKWLIQQRIHRDIRIRDAKEEIIICDRSPICPLVFAKTNLDEQDLSEVIAHYTSHSFAQGTYCHLTADPERVYQQLGERDDTSYGGSLEQVTQTVRITEAAYQSFFHQYGIHPILLTGECSEVLPKLMQIIVGALSRQASKKRAE